MENKYNKGKIYLLKENVYSLHIRKSPNANSKDNIIGAIIGKNNPIIFHEGQTKKNSDGSIWFLVTSYDTKGLESNKKQGWINSAYVRKLN